MIRLLTVAELSEALRISRSAVYRLALRRDLPSVKIGGAVRFDEEEIEKWLNENRREVRP